MIEAVCKCRAIMVPGPATKTGAFDRFVCGCGNRVAVFRCRQCGELTTNANGWCSDACFEASLAPRRRAFGGGIDGSRRGD